MRSRGRKDWSYSHNMSLGNWGYGCIFGKIRRQVFFFSMRKANIFIYYGKEPVRRNKAPGRRVQHPGWTFQLGISWLSKCSLKPAAIGCLQTVGNKGKRKITSVYSKKESSWSWENIWESDKLTSFTESQTLFTRLGKAMPPSWAGLPPPVPQVPPSNKVRIWMETDTL